MEDSVFKIAANTCSTVYVLWDYYRGMFFVDTTRYTQHVLSAQFFFTKKDAENRLKELLDIPVHLSIKLDNMRLRVKEVTVVTKGE